MHSLLTSKSGIMTQSAQTTISPNHHKVLDEMLSSIYPNLPRDEIVTLLFSQVSKTTNIRFTWEIH